MNDVNFILRPIEQKDMQTLYRLICDLADNQNEWADLTVTAERLVETGSGDHPLWYGYIAQSGDEPAGYVTYTQDFHIWSGSPRIMLDDIYVSPEFRSHGLGEAMMRRVFEEAEKINALVSWTVQPGNERAIEFYERLGAQFRVIGKCGWRPGE